MDRYPGEIQKELSKLSSKAKLLFGAVTCDHLYPNYLNFQKKINWGNPHTLRDAIDVIYLSIANDSLVTSDDIPALLDQVELNTPRPDSYPGADAYLALDACTAVMSGLEYIITADPDCIVAIATYARDTVGTYIRVRNGFERHEAVAGPGIAGDPLMIYEKQRQLKLIQAIAEADVPKFTQTFIENLRGSFSLLNIKDM